MPLLGNNPVANKFTYTPKWTAGVGVRYAAPLGSNVGELVLNADLFYSARTWFVERPLDTNGIQGPYQVTNARLEWNDVAASDFAVSLYVRNLFDRTYATAGGVITPAVTATTEIYNEPRVYGVEVHYSFGHQR